MADMSALSQYAPWLIAGGATTGVLAIFSHASGYLKAIWSRIVGLLIITIESDHDLAKALSYYVWTKGKRLPMSGYGTFGAGNYFVQPVARHLAVAFESIESKSLVFMFGYRPIRASLARVQNGPDRFSVSFLRWTFGAEDFINRAVDFYNDRQKTGQTRFAVHYKAGSGLGRSGAGQGHPNGSQSTPSSDNTPAPEVRFLRWKISELGVPTEHGAALERMSMTPEMESAITEARQWLGSKEWYRERAIPWRRGWLLAGPPGTGKTSFVRAMGQDLDVPIYHFDLGSMTNNEFMSAWNEALVNTPCFVLIEDIDGVFHGRKNIVAGENNGEKSALLDFSTLLNAISGVTPADGVMTIITTNHVEHVDEALGVAGATDTISTRPGRLDRVITMQPLTEQGRQKLAARILAGEAQEVKDRLVSEGAGDTGAQFQERCRVVALRLHWDRQTAKPVSDAHARPVSASG
jgi:hypothetical protein